MAERDRKGNLVTLEREALKRLDKLRQAQRALRDIEGQIASASHDRLIQIGQVRNSEKSLDDLDKEIIRELENLRKKYERAPRDRAPDPDFQWSFIEELYRLLDKLIRKAWRLQNRDEDELPPPPKPPDFS